MREQITTIDKIEVAFYLSHQFTVSEVNFIKTPNHLIPEFTIKGNLLEEMCDIYKQEKYKLDLSLLTGYLKQVDKIVDNEFEEYLEHENE